MSEVILVMVTLLSFGGDLGTVGGDMGKEVELVEPHTIAEAGVGTAGAFVSSCINCHFCVTDAYYTDEAGISTRRTETPIFECEPWHTCLDCDPTPNEDAELALTELIDSGGEDLLGWVDEYHSGFALTVIGSTLQISRQCGSAITWLALGDSELMMLTELIEQ